MPRTKEQGEGDRKRGGGRKGRKEGGPSRKIPKSEDACSAAGPERPLPRDPRSSEPRRHGKLGVTVSVGTARSARGWAVCRDQSNITTRDPHWEWFSPRRKAKHASKMLSVATGFSPAGRMKQSANFGMEAAPRFRIRRLCVTRDGGHASSRFCGGLGRGGTSVCGPADISLPAGSLPLWCAKLNCYGGARWANLLSFLRVPMPRTTDDGTRDRGAVPHGP